MRRITPSSFVGGAGSPCLHSGSNQLDLTRTGSNQLDLTRTGSNQLDLTRTGSNQLDLTRPGSSGSNQREGAEMNQLELMAAGERPIVKVTILDVKENFDIAHFDEPELDSAVSCLSAKYHTSTEQIPINPDDELTWYLPGWGKAKDDCGEYLKAVGCPDHNHSTVTGEGHTRKVVLKHCHNPECPICYVPWAVREGNAAAERMKAAERLYRADGEDLQEARHFTFSPPQEAAKEMIKTKKGYKRLKAYTVKLIKKSGIKGGVVIFHSHRINKYKKLYLSPHFHIIGYGYVLDTTDFNKKFPGWIIKNMGARASLAGTIIYALDHCGLAYEKDNPKRIGHALTWFGCLSYNQVAKKEVIKDEITIPCKACSADLHLFALIVNPDGHGMNPDWNNDLGVYHVKVKTIVYELVKKKKRTTAEDRLRVDEKIKKNSALWQDRRINER